VLIASTVVEVGIDEPEASVMLVENARCFGMAQLHQLRGRVGRGARESRCFLMAPEGDADVQARLRVMEASHNGLHIAEADLRMRCARWGGHGVHGAAEARSGCAQTRAGAGAAPQSAAPHVGAVPLARATSG
jgi:hypothetical protein